MVVVASSLSSKVDLALRLTLVYFYLEVIDDTYQFCLPRFETFEHAPFLNDLSLHVFSALAHSFFEEGVRQRGEDMQREIIEKWSVFEGLEARQAELISVIDDLKVEVYEGQPKRQIDL